MIESRSHNYVDMLAPQQLQWAGCSELTELTQRRTLALSVERNALSRPIRATASPLGTAHLVRPPAGADDHMVTRFFSPPNIEAVQLVVAILRQLTPTASYFSKREEMRGRGEGHRTILI